MHRGTLAAVAAIAATLLLAGCSASSDDAGTPEPATSAVVDAPTSTTAPLTAETPSAGSDDARFLAYVRENLPPRTVIPNATDEQLLAAGEKACDLIAAGTNPDDMTVIDGEQRSELGYYNDSGVIVTGAAMFLCA